MLHFAVNLLQFKIMIILTRLLVLPLSRGTRSIHSRKLSILFFGTDEFSVSTLLGLHKELHQQNRCISRLEICCPPMKTLICPVKKVSEQLSIKIHTWPPDSHVCNQFDLGVVASFGHMIPSRIIGCFEL